MGSVPVDHHVTQRKKMKQQKVLLQNYISVLEEFERKAAKMNELTDAFLQNPDSAELAAWSQQLYDMAQEIEDLELRLRDELH